MDNDELLMRAISYNAQFAPDVPPDTTPDPSIFQTKLSKGDEQKYQKWLNSTSKDTGVDYNPDDPGYDMRGYWQDIVATGKFKKMGEKQHFPDTYKTPYHPTFSRESKFASPDAPYWNKNDQLLDPTTDQPTPGFLLEMMREQ